MLILAASLLLAGSPRDGMAGSGGRGTAPSQVAPYLSCDGTCVIHLVAGDWPGSGPWVSRDPSKRTFTAEGTPVKQPATIGGRQEITFAAGSFLSAASAVYTITGASTVEAIVKFPSSSVASYRQFWSSGIQYGTAGGSTIWLFSADLSWRVLDSAGTDINTGGGSAASLFDRYAIIHGVTETGSGKHILYVNGSAYGTTSTISAFASGSGSHQVRVGSAWPNSVSARWPGSVVELLLHNTAFQSATVVSRSAAFNAIKGY